MTYARLTRREWRLGSGLVMFTYVAIHFVDHALGLVSLDVAERALALSVALWHSLAGTLLLYGAAAVHVSLAFLAVYERRTLRMPPAQLVRIALGLGMPVLLIGHVAATRMASDLFALAPTYHRIVWALWISDAEGRQLSMQAPGWIHGCMGLHFAFGRHALWHRARGVLFGVALLLPVLAGLGFLAMGRELAAQAAGAEWLAAAQEVAPATRIALGRLRDGMLTGYFALIGLLFAARELRAWIERGRKLLVSIAYPLRTVDVPRGWSVLEASRAFGIPHLSLCGGNARCSTCRVRVTQGAHGLPPPSPHERRTLKRIGAPDDVRLACQLRPQASVTVEPLLDPLASARCDTELGPAIVEDELAMLMVRLTAWSASRGEAHSAHDAVYALNRVLDVVARAVESAGGQPGQFDNDGASATFSTAGGGAAAALRRAWAAAVDIERELGALNQRLGHEVGLRVHFVIALHIGAAALGPVGRSGDRRRLPVGEAVRAARALRDHAAAQHDSRFAISRAVASALQLPDEGSSWAAVRVPGGDALFEARVSGAVPLSPA